MFLGIEALTKRHCTCTASAHPQREFAGPEVARELGLIVAINLIADS
jgi:hypothetical protein